MTTDHLYENPPLVEVIAELHWALKSLDTIPGSKLDPYYDHFKAPFLSGANDLGLTFHEELIPPAVPVELVGDQPQLRLRRSSGLWPLVQIGPGVLTINTVPPYSGWSDFTTFLHSTFDLFFSTYPMLDTTLTIERLHLRYIDGFDQAFGLDNYSNFLHSHLGMSCPLPSSFTDNFVLPNSELSFALDAQFLNHTPEGSQSRLKASPGKLRDVNAVILELICESHYSDRMATSNGFVRNWFDQAHSTLSRQFHALLTKTLIEKMGPRRPIGGPS